MDTHAALPTFPVSPGTPLAQAQPWNQTLVTLESPALAVMTDLTQVKAATTHPGTTLRQAEQMMIYQGVRMLFVVTDMPSVEGLVTAADLQGEQQMRVGQERHLRYDDLCVADVMTQAAELDAVDHAHVQAASVGSAISTLKRLGRHHLLVVEAATTQAPRRIRGVISLSQIARQLGTPLDVTPIARNFSEIERVLA